MLTQKNPLYQESSCRRRIKPMTLHQAGQPAQHTTNELFRAHNNVNSNEGFCFKSAFPCQTCLTVLYKSEYQNVKRMHNYETPKTAGHQKPYMLRFEQPFLASLQRKTKVKQFRGLWLWKRLTSTIQQHPGHASTPMVQLKTPQGLETEDVVLHQAPRQTSIICASTWWDTVLELQS